MMTSKPNTNNIKKEGKISYTDKIASSKQTVLILNEMKHKNGEMIRVIIDKRTSIELPSSLSQAEINERVTVYLRTHNLEAR
jgi:hypothetical protein